MEGCLGVSNKEGVGILCGVLRVHHGEVLGVASVVLLEGGVLGLPGLVSAELSEVPPVLEALSLILRHLNLIHDHVLELAESRGREILVELDVSCLRNLIEAQLSDRSNDLSLGGAREKSQQEVK